MGRAVTAEALSELPLSVQWSCQPTLASINENEYGCTDPHAHLPCFRRSQHCFGRLRPVERRKSPDRLAAPRRRTYAILHNVKLDGGRIEYHPSPGSSEQPPKKLPLTFYKTEPRATIEVVQRRAHGNDTGNSLTCAPDLGR